jgi:hypothetical protein
MYSYHELEDRATPALAGLVVEATAVALADSGSRIKGNGEVSTRSGVPNEGFAVICKLMSLSEEPSSGRLVMVCCQENGWSTGFI